MKLINTLLIIMALCFTQSLAKESRKIAKSPSDVSVKGYTKKDGTDVTPYKKATPNNDKKDNFSTKENINPYTGKEGTKSPY